MIKYNPLLHGTPQAWDQDRKPASSGGGGGSSSYYDQANRLYGIQADTAQFMLGQGSRYLPGAVDSYAKAASDYGNPQYESTIVGRAGADAEQSIASENASRDRTMAAMGINPSSGRFAAMTDRNSIQGAALKAGAMNSARDFVENKKFGAAKDFYSSLVGMNSDAAAQAGQSGSGFASLGNSVASQQNSSDSAWGSAVGMGAAMLFKDGGEVSPRRMASGGLFGGARGAQPVPVTARPIQPQNNPTNTAIRGYKTVKAIQDSGGLTAKGGAIAKNVGSAIGNDSMTAWGTGREAAANGVDVSQSAQAYKDAGMTTQAQGLIDGSASVSGMPGVAAGSEQAAMLADQTAGMGAGTDALVSDSLATTAGADAAGAGAAGAAGAEAAGAGAGAAEAGALGTGALEAMSAAMPWIGAGIAVGSLFGLFADGGAVDGQTGGHVAGPGTETSDSVNAKLSTGEFVENAESVKMPRKEIEPVVKEWMKGKGNTRELLHKINAAGLAKRYGVN